MSELRFALITSGILVASHLTALNVTSLDRVLAYVGSTGSTAISFILPGVFYYKISDPDGTHHHRLTKEDDDVIDHSGAEEEVSSAMAESTSSLRSVVSVVSNNVRSLRKWRWDLEHLEHGLLRKMALGLSIYGVCVMLVCLTMNIFFSSR
jgi:amino acid permease